MAIEYIDPTENDYPVLFVIVRNDIPSMNSGKAEAHSGHAASKFVYDTAVGVKKPTKKVDEWLKAADGFGTQINLDGSLEDIIAIEHYLNNHTDGDHGITYSRVTDPTYPWFNPITNELMLREEVTAFYIFGMKSNKILSTVTQHMRLKP